MTINFKISGPIRLSGDGNTGDSPANFIETYCGVSIPRPLTVSGVFQAAENCEIELSGSANYSSPHAMSEFYGMGLGCCILTEDVGCVLMETNGNIDLETCPGEVAVTTTTTTAAPTTAAPTTAAPTTAAPTTAAPTTAAPTTAAPTTAAPTTAAPTNHPSIILNGAASVTVQAGDYDELGATVTDENGGPASYQRQMEAGMSPAWESTVGVYTLTYVGIYAQVLVPGQPPPPVVYILDGNNNQISVTRLVTIQADVVVTTAAPTTAAPPPPPPSTTVAPTTAAPPPPPSTTAAPTTAAPASIPTLTLIGDATVNATIGSYIPPNPGAIAKFSNGSDAIVKEFITHNGSFTPVYSSNLEGTFVITYKGSADGNPISLNHLQVDGVDLSVQRTINITASVITPTTAAPTTAAPPSSGGGDESSFILTANAPIPADTQGNGMYPNLFIFYFYVGLPEGFVASGEPGVNDGSTMIPYTSRGVLGSAAEDPEEGVFIRLTSVTESDGTTYTTNPSDDTAFPWTRCTNQNISNSAHIPTTQSSKKVIGSTLRSAIFNSSTFSPSSYELELRIKAYGSSPAATATCEYIPPRAPWYPFRSWHTLPVVDLFGHKQFDEGRYFVVSSEANPVYSNKWDSVTCTWETIQLNGIWVCESSDTGDAWPTTDMYDFSYELNAFSTGGEIPNVASYKAFFQKVFTEGLIDAGQLNNLNGQADDPLSWGANRNANSVNTYINQDLPLSVYDANKIGEGGNYGNG
jgi:hypothetical protein